MAIEEQVQSLVSNNLNKPSDSIPPENVDDANIDKSRLSTYILEQFTNSIADKQDNGWLEKTEWEIKSYYSEKDERMKHWPWEGASAHPVSLTPTMVDTAHALTKASIWSNSDTPIRVKNVGVEDERTAPILENLINWQITNESNIQQEMDMNLFSSWLHGTGILKIMRGANGSYINSSAQDIENIFLPIDSKGMQVKDAPFVFQVVALNWVDLQYRKALGVYSDLDKIQPGMRIAGVNYDVKDLSLDTAYRTNISQYKNRDLYYLLECYVTYFEKDSLRPKELIVWVSPSVGTVHRVIKNEDGIRPFAEVKPYPQKGCFWGMSMPTKLRNIQEQINYCNKQQTDAADVAITPPGFFDSSNNLNMTMHQRVPAGMYPMSGEVKWAPQPPVDMTFERRMFNLWSEAERLTGLIDVTQGGSTKSGRTLGETQIRKTSSDIRFKSVIDNIGYGIKKMADIVYEYDNRYMPRDKKLRVLGKTDIQTVNELFPLPNGQQTDFGLSLQGKFDFKFNGNIINEKEDEIQNKLQIYDRVISNPLTVSNPANLWRAMDKLLAKPLGEENLELIVSKPPEVDIMSPNEFIQRIISGQYDLNIRPGIDTNRYIFEIQLFMRTESYKSLDPQAQYTLQRALRIAVGMQQRENLARMDMMLIQQGDPNAITGIGAGANSGPEATNNQVSQGGSVQ